MAAISDHNATLTWGPPFPGGAMALGAADVEFRYSWSGLKEIRARFVTDSKGTWHPAAPR